MYTAIAIQNGYYIVLCKPSTKEHCEQFRGSEKKGETFMVMKVEDVLKYNKVIGREYLK